MSRNLRDYQQQASNAIVSSFHDHPSALVVLPTGCGKTVLMADVIRRMQPKRAMIVAHREELIEQAKEKITAWTGLECGIEMADSYAPTSSSLFGSAPVVVSTIQTQISGRLKRRMERFNPMEFGLLVIDEAHHATSKSYRKIIDHYRQNPHLRVLGLTATPDRSDEEALGQVFSHVAYDFEILDAIHQGYLVPIRQQMVTVEGLDFSAIRTTANDLNGADLGAVMESESAMQGVASAALEIIGTKRTLVFASSVRHAEMLSEIFNRHRAGMSDWVCGKTDKDRRREILSRFHRGDVQVICNCGVLTEGFDNPGVEVIVMARPTKSRSLYAQMAGRSTRPLPGLIDNLGTPEDRRNAIATSAKPSALIVDFVGNAGKHKLVCSADILGGKVSEEAVELATRKAQTAMVPVDMTAELIAAEEELARQREERRQAEIARKARLIGKASFTSVSIDPFDILQLTPAKERGWDKGRELSEKQRTLLRKQGIDPDSMNYTAAKQLIGEMTDRWSKHLCTLKQAKVLRRFGYDPTNMLMTEATALIDSLAKNGWRRAKEVAA